MLPKDADAARMTSELKKIVLSVHLPRLSGRATKVIEIKVREPNWCCQAVGGIACRRAGRMFQSVVNGRSGERSADENNSLDFGAECTAGVAGV